ncbi:hypothetical protein [Haloferula sp. BvORR071]|uniref:hypothetical protein n=1 Tax=Haloferula sp. BvORR071 TaxID=1396141 RepID=UPI000554BA29|nr:hypothetical protein [Haloferula sp. BvORR071]
MVFTRHGLLPYTLAASLLLSGPSQAVISTWTNSAGQGFQAQLVRVDGANAIFTLEGGRAFTCPLANLSASDQVRARNHRVAPPPTGGGDTPGAPSQASSNLGYAWPREIRMDGSSQSKVISEDPKKNVFIYESPHYRFTSNVRLTSDVLRNFAMMFETTWKYATSIPLGLDGGTPRQGRLDILLFETKEQYLAAGGRAGSAACYSPGSGAVLTPLDSLGLRKTPTGFSIDTTATNSVLIHELTHQVTPRSYMSPALRNGWFVEGLAEYICTTPYSWGYFRPDPYGNAVLAFVTAYGEDKKNGRALGAKISAPHLRQFMQMDYDNFAGPKGNLHYGLGLLLTHYFLHMEGGGRSQPMTAYLKGIRSGSTGDAALAPLLGGSTYERLEADFADAWRKKGLEITFE